MTLEESIDRFAQEICAAGARHAFGITGSGPSLSLITSLTGRGVSYVNASHEASAAIMAGAATRIGGTPAMSMSIKGPGLVNALAGIAYNRFEDIPSISISEAYGHDSPRWRAHKRLDQASILAPVVKRHVQITELAGRTGSLLCEAAGETPGPVHIDLCVGLSTAVRDTGVHLGRQPELVDPALRRIRAASRPLVIAGSVVRRLGLSSALSALSVPVLTTAAGRGLVTESSPSAAGVFTGDGKERSPEQRLLAECDLVVAVGVRPSEITGQNFGGSPIIRVEHVAVAAEQDFPRSVECHVLAGVDGFREVISVLGGFEWGQASVVSAIAGLRDSFASDGWLPAHCFLALDRLATSHILVLDTGSFCTIGEHAWRAIPGRTLVGSNNGRFMGGSIPSAIGAAVAAPGTPVYCAVGDGGMQAYPAELKTMVDLGLPICVLFMSDGQYGSIACAAPSGAPVAALRMRSPSWHHVARAVGMDAVRCESQHSFDDALARWDGTGPLFVECAFDRSSYLNMTKGLR